MKGSTGCPIHSPSQAFPGGLQRAPKPKANPMTQVTAMGTTTDIRP
jgi:hypothetical protein